MLFTKPASFSALRPKKVLYNTNGFILTLNLLSDINSLISGPIKLLAFSFLCTKFHVLGTARCH